MKTQDLCSARFQTDASGRSLTGCTVFPAPFTVNFKDFKWKHFKRIWECMLILFMLLVKWLFPFSKLLIYIPLKPGQSHFP